MIRTVVLVRHGQSQANADGLFTGVLDAPLTDRGRMEAVRAAQLLDEAALWPPVWFSSPLQRATESAEIMASQVRRSPKRIEEDWRLTERNYGALTGRSKKAVLAEYGERTFLAWRRSVDIAPPPMDEDQRRAVATVDRGEGLRATEALRDVIVRVAAVWLERIMPILHERGSVLVVAHGNSLRALCTVLDHLSDEEVRDLNLPTGHPLVYRLDAEDHPIERGGGYLDPDTARAAAEVIAREGGT